jgi:ABC-type lipoprotein export system ATPase subunit
VTNEDHPVFSIRNLSCAYGNGPVVLNIDWLDIQSGRLIFVIGPSGSGKSTLIETLGLMNRTIRNGDSTEILLRYNNSTTDLSKSWQESFAHRAEMRKNAFSFLFQDTNLMPNFTAGQNMCVALLMQGVNWNSAKQRVLEIMPKLDLDPDLFDRRTVELSGGQRQRIAFIRAFVASYEVLFGDEPTGNLDRGTSHKLMEILNNEAITKAGKTCIIVSHDLELAEVFGDVIIPIHVREREDGTKSGTVLKESVYHKVDDKWLLNGREPVDDIHSQLTDIIIGKSGNFAL